MARGVAGLPLGVRRALMRAVRSLLCAGFAWDWLLAAALVAVNFTVPGSNHVPAADRLWWPDDPALRYPAVESWLTEESKFPVEFGTPLAVAALAQLWRGGGAQQQQGRLLAAPGDDMHAFALSLAEAFAIESTFKKWMNLVGKQRPDWLERVKKGDPAALREGRTSYPSGHAAETTMAFGLLTVYLLGRLRLLTAAPPRPGHFLRVVLCLAPVGFAVFITLSRVAAYKHDFADVNAGMAIGLLSGALAYCCNFYSPLDDARAGLPRLRPAPPPPAWAVRLLGADAVPGSGRGCGLQAPAGEEEEDEAGGGGGLREPLSGGRGGGA